MRRRERASWTGQSSPYVWQLRSVSLIELRDNQSSPSKRCMLLNRVGHLRNRRFATPESALLADEQGRHHTSNFSTERFHESRVSSLRGWCRKTVEHGRLRWLGIVLQFSPTAADADTGGPLPPPARVFLTFLASGAGAAACDEVPMALSFRFLIDLCAPNPTQDQEHRDPLPPPPPADQQTPTSFNPTPRGNRPSKLSALLSDLITRRLSFVRVFQFPPDFIFGLAGDLLNMARNPLDNLQGELSSTSESSLQGRCLLLVIVVVAVTLALVMVFVFVLCCRVGLRYGRIVGAERTLSGYRGTSL